MAIVILGADDDEQGMHVQAHLRAAGQRVEVLDSRWFPRDLRISYEPAIGKGSLRFPDGAELLLDEIHAVYWRNYFGPLAPELPDPEQAFIAENDSRSLFESLLIRLPAKWVNSWQAYQSHQTKPAQFALVASQGIPVPDTVVTNDAEAVREFAARHPRVIYKPVQGGAHAQRLTARHLTEQSLQNLAYAPIALQEEISGTSVRVFVAGERVFACEFETRSLDYRDDPQALVHRHALPEDAASVCRKAAAILGLVWTGIDLQRTPDGRYVFLEANPSPMFLEFERRTGFPLTASLAELLAGT